MLLKVSLWSILTEKVCIPTEPKVKQYRTSSNTSAREQLEGKIFLLGQTQWNAVTTIRDVLELGAEKKKLPALPIGGTVERQ